jgi:putative peptide-modifying radical SAM enzyme
LLDDTIPLNLSYDLDTLSSFLGRDPQPSVTFYGGEPLLRSDLIAEIMERIPGVKYLLHTNGTLLYQLTPSVLHRLNTISVSLDGPETLTDQHRGAGTYRRVLDNIHFILNAGYSGELIARMTVPVGTDINGAVRYLARNRDHSFSSIHWQLDADFSPEHHGDAFRSWSENQYNPGIRTLIRYWVDQMKDTGEVLRWYPFIDPLQDMILGRKSLLRCGCGHESYCILTNGVIVPCPLMVGVKEHYIGHITSTHPVRLPRYTVKGRCMHCQIRDFCGGRCLYSGILGHWSEERKSLICETVRNLHDGLQEVLPEIQRLLENGIIGYQDLDHPRFEGCEIIP